MVGTFIVVSAPGVFNGTLCSFPLLNFIVISGVLTLSGQITLVMLGEEQSVGTSIRFTSLAGIVFPSASINFIGYSFFAFLPEAASDTSCFIGFNVITLFFFNFNSTFFGSYLPGTEIVTLASDNGHLN